MRKIHQTASEMGIITHHSVFTLRKWSFIRGSCINLGLPQVTSLRQSFIGGQLVEKTHLAAFISLLRQVVAHQGIAQNKFYCIVGMMMNLPHWD